MQQQQIKEGATATDYKQAWLRDSTGKGYRRCKATGTEDDATEVEEDAT